MGTGARGAHASWLFRMWSDALGLPGVGPVGSGAPVSGGSSMSVGLVAGLPSLVGGGVAIVFWFWFVVGVGLGPAWACVGQNKEFKIYWQPAIFVNAG